MIERLKWAGYFLRVASDALRGKWKPKEGYGPPNPIPPGCEICHWVKTCEKLEHFRRELGSFGPWS